MRRLRGAVVPSLTTPLRRLGSVINDFRKSSLGLEPLSLRSGPLILERLRIPTAFCWSPALIPKPKDWKSHIDVTGFMFHAASKTFEPDEDLRCFLDAGEPPVYIGCVRDLTLCVATG